MKKKLYHGWIYVEQEKGYKDHYSVQWGNPSQVKQFGYGAIGAATAVDHFETTLAIGPVKLEQTPLGLRVFTILPEEK